MGLEADFIVLAERLEALFGGAGARDLSDEETFNALALEVFAFQFRANAVYRGFCEGRGVTPARVEYWREIPSVPTDAFRFVNLSWVDPARAEATFLTSGTTRGQGARGRHPVARLALYRAAALPNFRAHLLPDAARVALLSLIPSPALSPESSLSTMMGFVADRWGEDVRWVGHPDEGPDLDAFLAAASELEDAGAPVLVAGTAFGFVHLTDAMVDAGVSVRLPEGSRLMETGGFKGRSRAVERDALYATLEERLGIPASRIVNEYGMTELLSQLYEPVLTAGPAARGRHVAPPWMRVHALDPTTLAPLPPDERGLLAFMDLANLGSVCHVLTQDVGRVSPDGLRLEGRAPGAEPRGCSLALEELLGAGGGRS